MKHRLNASAHPVWAVLGLSLALGGLSSTAWADEAAIRKNLPAQVPNLPKIDEVTKLPVAGLWEVRMGSEIVYTDDQGQYFISGEVIDTKSRVNLTKERQDKLAAFEFSKLPLKDAIVIKQGTGSRKMAVFVDPNCGYCKRFEKDLANIKNVTIYTFLYPILGQDSQVKSRDIWCSKDPVKTWRDWMLSNVTPPSTKAPGCDASALERNTELGRKHRVQGTPAAVFEDGSRAPGAVPAEELDKRLTAVSGKA